MISKIIVGVDGSAGAAAALRWTVSLVEAQRDRGAAAIGVTVLRAWQPPNTFGVDALGLMPTEHWKNAASEELEKCLLETPGAEAFNSVLREGLGASALLAEADAVDADLIVVGTRGTSRLQQLLLGSVSRRVSANGRRAVAVVPEDAPPFGSPTLVGFNGSVGAAGALRWASKNCEGEIRPMLAWLLPAQVASEPAYYDVTRIEEAANRRLIEGVRAEFDGAIPERIVPISKHTDPRTLLTHPSDAAQVVVGARSRHGVPGFFLGSVANYVAAHAKVAVIVAPPDS